MVPPELRLKRTKKVAAAAPPHTAFCAGCQSFRDLIDFGKGATQCRACVSSAQHGAMIAKTYGITPAAYDALMRLQGGRCAICRARPKSKRLAVDHDHKTGAVRGLLCSRCNHELMGAAWDSLAIAVALWHYLNTPPAGGYWKTPERAPMIGVLDDAVRPPAASDTSDGIVGPSGANRPPTTRTAPTAGGLTVLPIGSESVPGKRGVWRYYVEPDADPPF